MILFGERLKELRIEHNLTQKQLEIALDYKITRSAISLWELNKRMPTLDAVVLLAQYFGVTLDYLAGLED